MKTLEFPENQIVQLAGLGNSRFFVSGKLQGNASKIKTTGSKKKFFSSRSRTICFSRTVQKTHFQLRKTCGNSRESLRKNRKIRWNFQHFSSPEAVFCLRNEVLGFRESRKGAGSKDLDWGYKCTRQFFEKLFQKFCGSIFSQNQ